jgi:hypothetical protein
MSFSQDWLALREPADLAARDITLLSRVIAVAGENAVVLDLGSGTGSTARAFVDDACAAWTWRFIDGDAGLLDVAHTRHPRSECTVMNLRDIDDLPLDGVTLVTASALLDLMPHDWMCRLAARLSEAAIPFYAALNYDGVMQWSPTFEADEAITRSFNAHQQTDKGIGAAMGPLSGHLTSQILSENGFDVTLSDSPWQLGSEQADLHRQLIIGIGEAARQIDNPLAVDWAQKRSANVTHSKAIIGHTDLLAVPRRPN